MAAIVDKEKCTGCNRCVEICPVSAIKIINQKAIISDECIECRACIDECPNGAISLPG